MKIKQRVFESRENEDHLLLTRIGFPRRDLPEYVFVEHVYIDKFNTFKSLIFNFDDEKLFSVDSKGIEEGDQIGGPYELAKILLRSLELNNGFTEDDLRKSYLDWWKADAFDTGPTYASVFTKIEKGMEPEVAVKKVHQEFGFNTAAADLLIEPLH